MDWAAYLYYTKKYVYIKMHIMILRSGSAHGVIGDTSTRDMGTACFDPAAGIAPVGRA